MYDSEKTSGVLGVYKDFSEIAEDKESLSSMKILLYDIWNTSWGPKHFSEVVKAQEILSSL